METLTAEITSVTVDPKGSDPDNSSAESVVLNPSSFPEYRAALVIWKYCPPVLLLLGGFGNVATIFVLRRINWGQSTQHVFLTALAVVDLALLYTGLLRQWLRYMFDTDVRSFHFLSCKIHTWLVYSFGNSSAWLLTAVTVQRAMSVVWPHRMNTLCSTRKSTISVLLIPVASFSLYSVYLVMLELSDDSCSPSTDMLQVDVVWQWVDLLAASLIPSAILLFCNFFLASTLFRSAREATRLGSVRGDNDHSRARMARSMTIMLMTLSVTFLLLTLPVCALLLWERYMGESVIVDLEAAVKFSLAWAVANMLWYTNSAVNFLLYCLSGTKFRNEFIAWITCGYVIKDPMSQRGYNHSQSGSTAQTKRSSVEVTKF